MNLDTFIKAFVCPNTIVRLWTETKGGHWMLWQEETDKEVGMGWEITAGPGWQAAYADWLVIGVTDILCMTYPEAVNIVIQKPEKDGDSDGR